MNKYLAEKIASEYYALGANYARTKLASAVGKGVHAGIAGGLGLGFFPKLMEGSEALARKLAPNTFRKSDLLKRLSTLTEDVVGMTPYNNKETIRQVAANMGLKPGLTSDLQVASAIQNTLGKKVDSVKSFTDLLSRDALRAFRESKPDLFKGVGEIPSSETLRRFHLLRTPGLDPKELTLDKLKALKAEAAKAVDDFGGELSGVEKFIDATPALAALGGSAVIGRNLYKHLNRQARYR